MASGKTQVRTPSLAAHPLTRITWPSVLQHRPLLRFRLVRDITPLGITAAVLALRLAVASPLAAQQTSKGDLLVLAAASLTDVLPNVAAAWRRQGGVPVQFSFAGTSRLAPQALAGAGADIFISADEKWMQWLEARGGASADHVRTFLENDLVVVVPKGAPVPKGARGLLNVKHLALAGENVPAGRYAKQALEATGVWARVKPRVVRGGDVRGALEWVARGEADAGIVYGTDARAEPRVTIAFTFPDSTHTPIRYPAAVLEGSKHAAEAAAFLDFAAGPEGARIFQAAGFRVIGSKGGPPVSPAPPVAEPSSASVPNPASAIRISLLVALLATLVGLVPAVVLGWVLARRDFVGKTLLTTIVLIPLVMPPVVTGFLLLSILGRESLLGRGLGALGVQIPFTFLGAAVAALAVGLPLYVISVRGAFEAVDPHYEEVSWTLGSRPTRTFLRISLPLALPGIAAGAVLAFARALGEFGATVVLAGNVEGRTRTIALAVYTLLEAPAGRSTTWILVGASVALSVLALLGYEALARRQRRRLEDRHGL